MKILALLVKAKWYVNQYLSCNLQRISPSLWKRFVNHSSAVIRVKSTIITHFTHGLRRAMLTVLHGTMSSWRPNWLGRYVTWLPRSLAKSWSGQLARQPISLVSSWRPWSGQRDTFQYRSDHEEPAAAFLGKTSRKITIIACGNWWVELFIAVRCHTHTDEDGKDTCISDEKK